MLSFYLCGINAVDLYNCTVENIDNGRINYNRSKTKGKRKDDAFISIKITKKSRPLLKKYLGRLSYRYKTYVGLDAAINDGMKQLRLITGIKNVTFYYARHTFAKFVFNNR